MLHEFFDQTGTTMYSHELDRLGRLLERRGKVRDLFLAFKSTSRNRFPNWRECPAKRYRQRRHQTQDNRTSDVYTVCIYIGEGGGSMDTARVFRSGNSQAVRLPKQFRLKSKEVEIFRRGNEIVLREPEGNLARAFELLADLREDFELPSREKDLPQRRKGL